MLTKATIVILGTVIASAVAPLPLTSPEVKERVEARLIDPANVGSRAPKGDGLRAVGATCEASHARAVCADIFGASGPLQTITYQRRIGENTSVLVRLPVRGPAAQK
jgi:hypothetical protein